MSESVGDLNDTWIEWEIERMSEPGLLLTNLLKYLNNGKIK